MSKRLTQEEFETRLKEINPNIKVLDEYTRGENRIECECLVCGHKWSPKAKDLYRYGCPKCAGNIKLTQKDFEKKIKEINPNIKVLGEYTKNANHIECECLVCGHKWSPIAKSLLRGSGCPKCAGNQKLTQEEFETRLKEINPNIKVLGEYTRLKGHIECECSVCGHKWFPVAQGLLGGTGCPKCAGNQKLTCEELINRLKEINPDIKILGTYINSYTPIKCKCLKCGLEWNPIPNSLLRRHGCPECSKNAWVKKRTFTQEEFERRIKKNNPNIKILGEYTKSANRIECECLICGYKWSPIANGLLGGAGCPKCGIKTTAKKNTITREDFIERIKKVNPDIKVLGNYINSKTGIKCECLKCHHEWEPTPYNLLQGHGCPTCNHRNKLSHEDFIKILEDRNPHFKNIEFLSKYTKFKNGKIKCRCRVCGHEWTATACGLLHQMAGCPKCKRTFGTSYSENFIFYSLYYALKDKIEVLQGDTRAIGKELDIYLPEYKFAIEIGNWYHHEGVYDKDLEKYKLCQQNDIKLITIYDGFNENIQMPNNFYVYSASLAYEKDYKTLKEIVYMILNMLDIKYVYSEEDWKYIEQNLYYESDRLKLKQFKKLFNEKNPHSDTIEILNKHYTPKKIQCRCKICGREWVSTRGNLLNGNGCSDCGHKEAGLKKRKNTN